MDIIVLNRRHDRSRSLTLSKLVVFGILCFFLSAFGGVAYLGYHFGTSMHSASSSDLVSSDVIKNWEGKLEDQSRQIDDYKVRSSQHIDALTLRMGELQARLLRLDALGQRLTDVAGLDEGEFDFVSTPALGGPEEVGVEQSYAVPELTAALEMIEQQAESREQQLRLMDELFVNQKFQREQFVAGRPILKGWLSSYYGYRSDPFTGKRAWHAGVDFAGKEGSDIVAVAGGVVTHASERYGYGQLVEINHGGGLVTRYAHCKEILVAVGDVVQKGQALALMGSTGRSTGPHVHFEVRKNGKPMDPAKFIHRASR
ncbi:M23 family metallopeptidase [Hahella ganghwensis]|uniref:M23 family metallopeptidase n=1 Tax=Hahella ganghwensis TaxID=286420 RepID=UPI00036B3267|nr:M23 family metallopeptidase [Hahella ganghwensis]